MEIRRCMNCMEELSENEARCPACGTKVMETEQPVYALKCNYILHGRYLIGRVLGQGGFGITYIGLDMVLNIKVAVKEYFPMGMVTRDSGGSSKVLWNASQMGEKQRQSGYKSFLKEAQKMAKIDKIPSMVKVRDMFMDNETAYIVMEYVEGITLKQKLSQEGPMAFSDCIALLRPMMEDLAKVHEKGMVHRDISPDNIIIQPDGTACLLDLGAAKDMTLGDGTSSQLVAKKGFSPLEQYMDGEPIGPWTDVYALCATIYYCVTGKLLMESLKRIKHEDIDFPQNLKEPLTVAAENALKAGLNLRAEERTQNVEELLKQLKAESQKSQSAYSPEPEADDDSKMEPESDFKQREDVQTVSRSKPTLGQRLGKVKKSVWAAMGVCLIAAVVFVKIMAGSQTEESAEIPALPDTDVESEKDLAADTKHGTLPVMMGDTNEGVKGIENYTVLGSDIKRWQIRSITFQSTLKDQPEDAWDVSEKQDGTVMAWTSPAENDMYELYIGGEGGIQAPKICERMFGGYVNVEEIKFNRCFDTSQVINMNSMFDGCLNLGQLDVSGFDTSQVTDMHAMFYGCESLRQLDVSNFDTSQVTNMRHMFFRCLNLEQLNVSNFDTSRVMYMNDMFCRCESLEQLDVRNFDTSQVASMKYMFSGCESLEQLDLSGFDMSKVTDDEDMFKDCPAKVTGL